MKVILDPNDDNNGPSTSSRVNVPNEVTGSTQTSTSSTEEDKMDARDREAEENLDSSSGLA